MTHLAGKAAALLRKALFLPLGSLRRRTGDGVAGRDRRPRRRLRRGAVALPHQEQVRDFALPVKKLIGKQINCFSSPISFSGVVYQQSSFKWKQN